MLVQQLITFMMAVEAGSFTRAGELLNLSQPTVTRQIAALEAELACLLLERTGRTYQLTPRGQLIYEYAVRVSSEWEQLRSRLDQLEDPTQGQVSLASVTTTGLFTLPPLLAEFNGRYPKVHFRIWSGRVGGVIERVLGGQADLGFVTAPYIHPRLTNIPLFDDPVILVGAPERADRFSGPLSLDQLAAEELICYQAPSRFRTLIDSALAQVGVQPRITMELESHEAVKTMTLMGYGLALVPRTAVAEQLAAGSLVELRVTGLPPVSRTTCLLLPQDRQARPPEVENFIELVRQRLVHNRGELE